MPRVGGIAVALGYLCTFAVAFVLPLSYTFILRNALPSILELTMVASVIFFYNIFTLDALTNASNVRMSKPLLGV
jgi:hypothetical protein